MAGIIVDVDGIDVVATITKDSAKRLALADGMSVTAIIKATAVMIGVG